MKFSAENERFEKGINKINKLYYNWAKIKRTSYNTLNILYIVYKEGTCTQKHICEQWQLPKQTVNTYCRMLREKSVLIFEVDKSDRREKLMRFSEKGLAFAVPIIEELL